MKWNQITMILSFAARRLAPLLVLALILHATHGAVADGNWPRFRGVNATGVAPDHAALPTTWTTSENVKWVADVPGWGWSCPIVWGERVFVTSVVSEEENLTPSKGLYLGGGVRDPAQGVHHWMVYCFNLNTGEQLWQHEAHIGRPKVPRHPKSTYAAETPTTDGERLYVLFGDLGLYCYDLDGNPLWSHPIEPKKTFLDYGAAASPVVHDGQVIVIYDNLESSWIAGFDAKTGDERWRTARDETHSWATPLVWQNDLRTEIVVPGKNRNRGYSLDGELLWEFDGRMSNLVIPSPFAAGGLCYIASGYVGDAHRPTFALRPGASGNIAPDGGYEDSEYIAWYQGKSSPYNPSQIVYGDYLYTLYDQGFLTCHDAKTGEELYGKQRFRPRGSFTASPFAYNGHLFFLSEDGLTYVMKADPDFEIFATNDLGELCLSSPAIAGDKLLIRTASALYCITEGAALPPEVAAARRGPEPAASGMPIWTAAAKGDLEALARSLAGGISVNAKNAEGATPLMMAALHGQSDAARMLMDEGADVALGNREANTALHMAAFMAHPEIVSMLLEKGAKIDARNARGESTIDVVSADWSTDLENLYTFLGEALEIELDLPRVKKLRPEIRRLLRDRWSEETASKHGAQQARRSSARRVVPPITSADWASYNHDARGWRYNSGETTLSADNAHQLEEKWRYPAEDSPERVGVIHATPVVVNGHVYFGTATYPAFYKLRPDGTLAWVYRLKEGVASPTLPQGGRNLIDAQDGVMTSALVTETSVFFGNSAGVFFALDRLTGEELWKVDTRAEGFAGHHPINIINASAILADGKVVVGGGGYEHAHPLDPNYSCCTGRGFVVAFDPADGRVIWKYDVGEEPQEFDEPVVIEDANGKHVFKYGPSTSSVWSTPSYDAESGTVFFGTDVHNSPRRPTPEDPRYDTKYSAAVVAVDVKTGREKWVTQLNEGDIYNHTMSGYDPNTGRYKDCSVGDTPKVYSVSIRGQATKVVGVGCKNGGFYVLGAGDGRVLANTRVFAGKPEFPLEPHPGARMIALPSPLGGIQTGCATDGKSIFTNGLDWLLLNTKRPGAPEGGRVVSVSGDLAEENWRHERPEIRLPGIYTGGDPVASGIALGGGIACFAPAVSEQLVVLNAASGEALKEIRIGTVWSGPSISRGRIYIGTGSILFLKKKITGTLYSFGLPGEDEVTRMGAGSE